MALNINAIKYIQVIDKLCYLISTKPAAEDIGEGKQLQRGIYVTQSGNVERLHRPKWAKKPKFSCCFFHQFSAPVMSE